MKKILVIIASLALVACGSNNNKSQKTDKTAPKTETKCSDAACTEDHSKEKSAEHVHEDGSVCTGDHKEETATAHTHEDGTACTGDHSNEVTHKHEDGTVCTGDHDHEGEHQHAEGEACCGHDHNAKADDAEGVPCNGEGHGHPDPNFTEVKLKESQAKAAQIRIYTVKPTEFAPVIKTTGKISSNKTDKKVIVAPVSGTINILKNNLIDGAPVEKGALLVSISSDNIEGGDVIKKTTARYLSAKADYERAESLIGDQLISRSDYNALKLAYQTAKAEYEAIKSKSGTNGVRVTSPIKGYINELLVKDGEYVTAGTPIAMVSANNKSLLTAYVSERYYGRLKNISDANFKTAYDNKVYNVAALGGKFIAYGKGENDESYMVPVTFEFNNNSDILPGSFVEVYLKEKGHKNALVVPVSSVTEEQNVYYVYVHRGEHLYRKHEVKLGANDGKFVEIISGVNEGDKVVCKGTYQIKLASSSGAIPAACGHQH